MTRFFYRNSSLETHGPFTTQGLREEATAGRLVPDNTVWMDGSDKEYIAKNIKGLFSSTADLPQAESSPQSPWEASEKRPLDPNSKITYRKNGTNSLVCNCSYEKAINIIRAATSNIDGLLSDVNLVSGKISIQFSYLSKKSNIDVSLKEIADGIEITLDEKKPDHLYLRSFPTIISFFQRKKRMTLLYQELINILSSPETLKRLDDPAALASLQKREQIAATQKSMKTAGALFGLSMGIPLIAGFAIIIIGLIWLAFSGAMMLEFLP